MGRETLTTVQQTTVGERIVRPLQQHAEREQSGHQPAVNSRMDRVTGSRTGS